MKNNTTPKITAGHYILKTLASEILTVSPLFEKKKHGLSFLDQMNLLQKMEAFVSESLQEPLSSIIKNPPQKAVHHPALFNNKAPK